MHGFIDLEEVHFKKFKLILIEVLAQKIIFVSNHLKTYFENNCPILFKKKNQVIYNGIKSIWINQHLKDRYRKQYGVKETEIVLGSVGNISPAKGYAILLKAASIIIAEYPQCKFIIAGELRGTHYLYLKKIQFDLKIENSVKFIGYQENIDNFLSIIDIFILPSTSEGFSLSTVEAMSVGIPVIVTKSGGPQEIVKNEYNGLLVSPGVPEELSKAILAYITNKNLKGKCAFNGFKYAKKNFSIFKMINEYEKVYSGIGCNNKQQNRLNRNSVPKGSGFSNSNKDVKKQ